MAIVIIFAKLNIFRADNNHLLYGISFYTHRHPNNMMYSFFHWSGCSVGSEGSITYFLLSPKLRVMQVQIPGKGIRWRRRGVWAQSVYSFLVLGCFGGPVPGIRMGSPRLGGVSGAGELHLRVAKRSACTLLQHSCISDLTFSHCTKNYSLETCFSSANQQQWYCIVLSLLLSFLAFSTWFIFLQHQTLDLIHLLHR